MLLLVILDALNASSAPVLDGLLTLVIRKLQLIFVNHCITVIVDWIVLLYIYMVALDHRDQDCVSLPQLRKLLRSFYVSVIERIFSFKILKHFLVSHR